MGNNKTRNCRGELVELSEAIHASLAVFTRLSRGLGDPFRPADGCARLCVRQGPESWSPWGILAGLPGNGEVTLTD
ncbi:hypothetical protein RRG08_030143 [Elysia crispata]|uniref:Uncharacterized protein n=1 Tax=Elysia crispata TaxID=231223 RepID=A0AAE1DKK2_9GAST|nr:hypothetical protein RRG08_030143 [Elysia crispata]